MKIDTEPPTSLADDSGPRVEEIQALFEAEKWADALVASEHQLVNQPDNPRLLWYAGWALYNLGRYGESVNVLRKAAIDGPVDPKLYWSLAAALIELQQYPAAELWVLRALALRDSGKFRLLLAFIYVKMEQLEVADRIHQEGLRLLPASRKRLEAYADFKSDLGEDEAARDLLARAQGLGDVEQ